MVWELVPSVTQLANGPCPFWENIGEPSSLGRPVCLAISASPLSLTASEAATRLLRKRFCGGRGLSASLATGKERRRFDEVRSALRCTANEWPSDWGLRRRDGTTGRSSSSLLALDALFVSLLRSLLPDGPQRPSMPSGKRCACFESMRQAGDGGRCSASEHSASTASATLLQGMISFRTVVLLPLGK